MEYPFCLLPCPLQEVFLQRPGSDSPLIRDGSVFFLTRKDSLILVGSLS